jgi:beta-galactosidase
MRNLIIALLLLATSARAFDATPLMSFFNPTAVVDPVPDYVSRWLFDDNAATTNVLDDAGRNNGYATANSSVMHGSGKVGTGSFTNCAVDKVWVPDAANLKSNYFSVTAWAWQYANDPFYPNIAIKPIGYLGGNEQFGLGGNGGKLGFWVKATTMKYALGSANSMNELTGGWHFVAGVYDGTNVFIYLDGVERGRTEASGAISTTTNPLHIGLPFTGFNGLNGKIDDVRYYGRALTSNEQLTIYNAYK